MFYRTNTDSGLPHDPWMMCIIPRPIGWISSMSASGVLNLAPYSFFNAVAEHPPMIMFATNGGHPHGEKDTAANIRETGEFVCNMATSELREAVAVSADPLPPGDNEFDCARLTTVPSALVKPPRVKASPIHLECKLVRQIDLPSGPGPEVNVLTIGHVVGIHIDDSVMINGLIDIARLRPLARLGYNRFSVLTEDFTIPRSEERPRHLVDIDMSASNGASSL
jgi:flavin reductase (DIM6/NTAB) family NADH-FMN oxidoreductase RutF